MEIFQTIWTALTTENEIVLNILAIPLGFIEATISMYLFLNLLNISSSRRQKFFYILVFTTISIISCYFIPAPFNTFLNILTSPILVYFVFKTTILNAILAEIIPLAFFTVSGSILSKIYTSIFNVSTQTIILVPIHKFFGCLLNYLLVFLMYSIIHSFKITIEIDSFANKKFSCLLILNFVAGIVALVIQSYLITFYTNFVSAHICFSSVLVLLIYFLISIYSLRKAIKLEKATKNLEQEKLYNKTLTVLYDNIRGFKHDFNNIVQSIGGYVATDNLEGLKEYYSQILDDCQKSNNLSLLSPDIINNPAIYSLLASKYHLASELGINVNLEVFMDLSNINMKIYELTRILGILLDNSIEASKQTDDKQINIIIRKDNKNNKQLFIIENTYINKDINLDKIFEKGITSKESDSKSHGLGLWEVKQTLKKNRNLNLYTTKNDKYFKQQLEIYC